MTEQPPPEGMDRLPPQALEVEKAVLGACLLDKRGVSRAGEVIRGPDDFYHRAHGRIWMALVDMFDDDEAIDQLTLSEELKRRGQLEDVGGVIYLAELAGEVASSANVSHHAAILTEKALARGIIELGADMQRMAFDGDDPLEVLTHASEALYKMRDKRQAADGAVRLEVYLAEALEQFDRAHANPDTLTGVTTGLIDLDNLTAGWQASDLILLAARPSVGKTAAGLGFARAAAESGVPVLVQELEMPGIQVGQRMLASGSGVNLHQIRTGRIDDPLRAVELNAAAQRDSKLPIYIDDTGGLSITDIRTRARREQVRLSIGLVIIDYIQLVDPDTQSESTEREVSNISKGLQRMARELKIPVIALSQLSRASMSRKDKRPELSDLRGSGSLEQDADVIVFPHRPEAFGITHDSEGVSEEGKGYMIVGKQRNGPTETVKVSWDKKTATFKNLTPEYRNEEPPSWLSK